jgi:hypothetical protein
MLKVDERGVCCREPGGEACIGRCEPLAWPTRAPGGSTKCSLHKGMSIPSGVPLSSGDALAAGGTTCCPYVGLFDSERYSVATGLWTRDRYATRGEGGCSNGSATGWGSPD